MCNLASIALSNFVKKRDVNIKKAVIYTKTKCSYCKLSKALLNKFGVEFESVNLDDDEERKRFYEEQSAALDREIKSVPQIFIDDQYVGGWKELREVLKMEFDYEKLHKVTKVVAENLDRVIDVNFYPTEKTERSNLMHRPIGIGVQGLADAFMLMDIPFHSEEGSEVNRLIFETIYHAAIETSNKIAIKS